MPQPPGIIDRVNYIVDFLEDPCQAPWTVYVETAIAPAGELVIALLSFGLDDILRGYFRPKALRSISHTHRRTRGRKFRGGIPELGETIGKRLPGAEIVRARKITHLAKTLWLIDGVIQRFLWWWMVIDLVSEFLYDWATLLNQSEFCSKKDKCSVAASGSGSPVHVLGDWMPVFANNVEKQRGDCDWEGSAATVADPPAHLTAGVTVRNNSSVPWNLELAWFHSQDPRTPFAIAAGGSAGPGESASGVINAQATKPGIYNLRMRVNRGFGETTDEIVSVIGA